MQATISTAATTAAQDMPLFWFAKLERAVETGDHIAAANAQLQLKQLGVDVRYSGSRCSEAAPEPKPRGPPVANSPDPLFGLQTAARQLPGRGGSPTLHPATLTRWIQKGVLTPAGRIRLRAVKNGSAWAVRQSWLDEFQQNVATANLPADAAPIVRTTSTRTRAANAAIARLQEAGA